MREFKGREDRKAIGERKAPPVLPLQSLLVLFLRRVPKVLRVPLGPRAPKDPRAS